MITPATPTRVTAYRAGEALWRLTLEREEREGRTLTYEPEIVQTMGDAPGFVISNLFRGFRPTLDLSWSYGQTSRLELWDAAAGWVDAGTILTQAVVLELLEASESGDFIVEPYVGAESGAFSARIYSEPAEIRDVKGVLHSGLKIKCVGTGGVRGDAPSAGLSVDPGFTAQIPEMLRDGRPLHLIVPGPAVAWDSTAVYRLSGSNILRWSPASGIETLWAAAPVGQILSIGCSASYLHVYLRISPPLIDSYSASNMANWPGWDQAYSIQSLRRKLDLSSGWEDRGTYGVENFASYDQSWSGCRMFAAKPFANGTSLIGCKYGNTGISQPPRQFLTLDDGSTGWVGGDAVRGVYYASAGRLDIGTWGTGPDDLTVTEAEAYTAAGNSVVTRYSRHPDWWANRIGGAWWFFDPATARAISAAGTERVSVGAPFAPPIPFGDRSLLVLQAGALWFDGGGFRPCDLGTQRSDFRTLHYGPPVPWAPAGSYYQLADGGLLQVV